MYKIDNLDMAAKDLRIVDSFGKPSHLGRVEIRLNGRWGSICNKDMQDSAAKVMCFNLGYKGGMFIIIRRKN